MWGSIRNTRQDLTGANHQILHLGSSATRIVILFRYGGDVIATSKNPCRRTVLFELKILSGAILCRGDFGILSMWSSIQTTSSRMPFCFTASTDFTSAAVIADFRPTLCESGSPHLICVVGEADHLCAKCQLEQVPPAGNAEDGRSSFEGVRGRHWDQN